MGRDVQKNSNSMVGLFLKAAGRPVWGSSGYWAFLRLGVSITAGKAVPHHLWPQTLEDTPVRVSRGLAEELTGTGCSPVGSTQDSGGPAGWWGRGESPAPSGSN